MFSALLCTQEAEPRGLHSVAPVASFSPEGAGAGDGGLWESEVEVLTPPLADFAVALPVY